MNFYSRGKLLLSGEYLVLKGATALAVPLKYGQELEVEKSGKTHQLSWESKVHGKSWFRALFALPFFDTLESSDPVIAQNLKKHFEAIAALDSRFVNRASEASVVTNLEFDREWGFGSSSTLIAGLAAWAGVDPFVLHRKVSAGSGYDVVAANRDKPFYFSTDGEHYAVEPASLHPQVAKGIYFVYLGKKAASSQHVADFLRKRKSYRLELEQISELSRHLGNASTLDDFAFYMKEHEQVMASVLKLPMIKEGFLRGFAGEAKSLGAWGGDFAMLTWNDSVSDLKRYLKHKQLYTVFRYNELVLDQ